MVTTIMRKIVFLTVVVGFTILISQLKTAVADTKLAEQRSVAIHSEIKAARLERVEALKQKQVEEARLSAIKAQQDAQIKPDEPPSTQASGISCREAIAQTWPSQLHSGAQIVLVNENRAEDPQAVGKVNSDGVGSRDYGCFQINDYWHKDFFATKDWRDPVANAAYAYQIYLGRANSAKWNYNGWTSWYAVQGELW